MILNLLTIEEILPVAGFTVVAGVYVIYSCHIAEHHWVTVFGGIIARWNSQKIMLVFCINPSRYIGWKFAAIIT